MLIKITFDQWSIGGIDDKVADTLISGTFVTLIYGIRDIWSKHYMDMGY